MQVCIIEDSKKLQDENKIPVFLSVKRKIPEFDVYTISILHIYPRSDRIEDEAREKQQYETSDELHDAVFRLFSVFAASGKRILDARKYDHQDADQPREIRGVFDERTERADDGIETGAHRTFVEPGGLVGTADRFASGTRNFFRNEYEGSFAFLFSRRPAGGGGSTGR